MEQDEFDELKEEILEVFQDDVLLTVTYRELNVAGSDIDARFGILNTESYTDVTLLCSVVFVQSDKTRKALGVSDDCRLLLTIPTMDIESKAVNIQREKGWFIYDGVEYEIVRIDPKPRMYGSSIVTRIELGKEKPLRS